ncbi:MAG TPA: penicillin acylase family protein, partial [Planctomycetaceae bacterium]|nr:penicillin acylase family protein [Planctomycetaceae bacterium]
MQLTASQLLARLGAGESITAVCEAAGFSRDEFQTWWRRETASRMPPFSGTRSAAIKGSVRIQRDGAGIPHIFAENDEDLFFGFGYATAQDRLFQLDYLRRRAQGRLSEVLGPEGIELDLVARTVGLHLIAEQEWKSLPDETRRLVIAYSNGINALIKDSGERLPIEFDLLGYRPSAWQPVDSLAIAGEFRWYLTGRFPVIVVPELAKRRLGTGPLYEAFLLAEAEAEAILPPGSYPATRAGMQPVGVSVNDPSEGHGSNNWVVSGAKALAGKPIVASDPHIAFAAVSCWHEVRLCGGSFNVAGIAYAGMPALMFGKNEHVAWGITNNLCSLRDLYQERVDPAHPGSFLFDGQWEPASERVEVIDVKGREPVRKTIRISRNGPIVDDILPPPAKTMGPIALRWLGASPCGWLTALMNMDRAKSADELRRATEPWLVPTFCVVFADAAGHIGYQCTGRIPIRNVWERGFRPGWDPAHQWAGLIPFEGMPHLADPPRGWIATANHRVAADDFPYPLSGTWPSGYRAVRIRQMLEGKPKFDRDDFARMHQDSVSLRAVECVPHVLDVLHSITSTGQSEAARIDSPSPGAMKRSDERATIAVSPEALREIRSAIEYLEVWDFRMEPDRVAASIFSVFFTLWSEQVANQRFSGDEAALIAGAIGGLAVQLIERDPAGWFESDLKRRQTLVQAFRGAMEFLKGKFGADMLGWSWGRLHTLQQKHFLSGRGELG